MTSKCFNNIWYIYGQTFWGQEHFQANIYGQTFLGQKHFQANITIITYFLKNLNNVRKQICFSGFKY
jgi:hypothetical protein